MLLSAKMKILMQKISLQLIVSHVTIVIAVKIMPIYFIFFFFNLIMHPNAKALMPSMGGHCIHTCFHMYDTRVQVWPSLCQSVCVVRSISQLSVGPLWRQDLKTLSRPLMTGSDRIYDKSHIYPSSVLQLSSDMAIYTVIHLFFFSILVKHTQALMGWTLSASPRFH